MADKTDLAAKSSHSRIGQCLEVLKVEGDKSELFVLKMRHDRTIEIYSPEQPADDYKVDLKDIGDQKFHGIHVILSGIQPLRNLHARGLLLDCLESKMMLVCVLLPWQTNWQDTTIATSETMTLITSTRPSPVCTCSCTSGGSFSSQNSRN